MMEERLNAAPLILQLPVGSEDAFEGVIDLIGLQQIRWHADTLGETFSTEEIPAALLDQAREYRELLIETLAESDDDIMEAYLAEEEIATKTIIAAIRKATIELELVPILCGSALKNRGIQPLLDAIIDRVIDNGDGTESRFYRPIGVYADADALYSRLSVTLLEQP